MFSCIQVQRLQMPFLVISISNFSISFLIKFYGFSQETIFKTGGILNQEATSHHNQIQFRTLIQEVASQKVQSFIF
jgi:ABC-type spermidine/putrescine transport system permease subunit I